jgi:hypothetical protein
MNEKKPRRLVLVPKDWDDPIADYQRQYAGGASVSAYVRQATKDRMIADGIWEPDAA